MNYKPFVRKNKNSFSTTLYLYGIQIIYKKYWSGLSDWLLSGGFIYLLNKVVGLSLLRQGISQTLGPCFD